MNYESVRFWKAQNGFIIEATTILGALEQFVYVDVEAFNNGLTMFVNNLVVPYGSVDDQENNEDEQ